MMNAMQALEEYKNKGDRVDEVLYQIVKAELTSMQNALRFYANDDTYKTQWITRNLANTADQLRAATAIRQDLGRLAREALKGSEQTIMELQQAYDHTQFELSNLHNAMEDLENENGCLRELLAHYEEAAASNAQSHQVMLNVSALLMQQVQHLSHTNGGALNESPGTVI